MKKFQIRLFIKTFWSTKFVFLKKFITEKINFSLIWFMKIKIYRYTIKNTNLNFNLKYLLLWKFKMIIQIKESMKKVKKSSSKELSWENYFVKLLKMKFIMSSLMISLVMLKFLALLKYTKSTFTLKQLILFMKILFTEFSKWSLKILKIKWEKFSYQKTIRKVSKIQLDTFLNKVL